MKKFLFFSLVLLLVSSGNFAQTLTRMQSWGLDFESIAWADAQEGIIVGENLIARTVDGGITWEEVLQKFELRFYDVVYLEMGKAVAVGENGSIYITTDGGKNWQKKDSGSQNNLLSIAKLSPTALLSAGENGELIASQDSGESWLKVNSGTTQQLNDITFANDSIGFIAANGGAILKSVDRGNSWTIVSLAQNEALYGIAFSNEMIGYAVGEEGVFLKTTDSGITWTSLNSPTTNTLRKVAISTVDARIVAATGDLATLIRTGNSGTSFTKPNLGNTNTRNLKGISFNPDSNLASAVGQDGYLINSTNGGTSWPQKLAGIRNDFTSIDFKNINSGFIAGENGALYVTANGATTLTYRPIPDSILIQSIDFWNTSFGYTGSADGKIYRTTNAGRNWVPVFTPENRVISGFYLFAPSVLYIAGSEGYISSSFESGNVWSQSKESNTTENLKDLMFFDFQYGMAIGENGQIIWSNGGTVWESKSKMTEENLNALAKIDTTRAFVVGDGGVILKTDDKGLTWKTVESGTTKNLNSIDFFGENYGFIAGEEGLVLVTPDGGATWGSVPSGTLRDLNSVSAGTDQKAYFSGDDGSVLAYICVAPAGNLGDITGDSQSCQVTTIYSISGLPEVGSDIKWRVDGGEILSGQGTSQIEVEWTTTGRNAVLVSRSNFCGTGETSSLEVDVIPTPPANAVISGDGTVCQGVLYSYSLPKIEDIIYTWTVIGGEINSGQGTHEAQITWNQNGEQVLTVAQENLCGSTQAISKAIVVNSAPASPLAISGESKVGLGEQTYEVDEEAGLNYRWSISDTGGKLISGQGTGSIVVVWEKEGDFELAVDAQNECGVSQQRVLPINVNLITALEPWKEKDLKIYPSPSQGELTITSASLDIWSSIRIFNTMGQLVKDIPITAGQDEAYFYGLPKGLLVVQFQGKNGALSKKVLVQ